MVCKRLQITIILVGLWATSITRAASPERHFDFGNGPLVAGNQQILPDTLYQEELGYGLIDPKGLKAFDAVGNDERRDGLISDTPYYFTVEVPEGNYRVTVTLGHPRLATDTTIKAELRRLMLHQIRTEAGQWIQKCFIINVRRPQFPGGKVRLKKRERTQEAWAWDGQLTLEINGKCPSVCAMDIDPAPEIPTVFLIGDSTVCDQARAPWSSWGQMLTRYFQPTVAIANHAESGESIRGSLGARRFDKIYSLIRPGDYLLIQFGHNDMKDKRDNASAIYKENLRAIVAQARERGATPVLLTSMERSTGLKKETLADYPDKVREVAAEDHVALIDLHKQSKILYRALGDQLMKAFQDGTHHNNYGSDLLAQCVTQGIRANKLKLSQHIRTDFDGFDPAHPGRVEAFAVAVSPLVTHVKPLRD